MNTRNLILGLVILSSLLVGCKRDPGRSPMDVLSISKCEPDVNGYCSDLKRQGD